MDYESKILLHRLVEEVEKLNSPDWWVIGITVVNAVLMLWLGWRQFKLQKQQTKIQEYELYRRMYNCVNSIYTIAYGIAIPVYVGLSKCDKIYWENFKKEILELNKEIKDISVDLSLKFPMEKNIKDKYKIMLGAISNVVRITDDVIQKDLIKDSFSKNIESLLVDVGKNEKELLPIISSAIKEGEERNELVEAVNSLLLFRKGLCNSEFIEKIRSRV